MIPVCYKFQPLRRFIKPAHRDYWVQRRNRIQQSQVVANMRSRAKGYTEFVKNIREKRKDEIKRKIHQFIENKNKKLKLNQKNPSNQSMKFISWKNRLYTWTESVAERVAKNERWKKISQDLKLPPKQFAYAIGEALVLYKITTPVWMPLELYLIVKYLQLRNQKKLE